MDLSCEHILRDEFILEHFPANELPDFRQMAQHDSSVTIVTGINNIQHIQNLQLKSHKFCFALPYFSLGSIYTWRRICRRSLDEVSMKSKRRIFLRRRRFLRQDFIDYFYLKFVFNIFCEIPFPTPKNLKQRLIYMEFRKKLKLN